jgi:hypothetical protein
MSVAAPGVAHAAGACTDDAHAQARARHTLPSGIVTPILAADAAGLPRLMASDERATRRGTRRRARDLQDTTRNEAKPCHRPGRRLGRRQCSTPPPAPTDASLAMRRWRSRRGRPRRAPRCRASAGTFALAFAWATSSTRRDGAVHGDGVNIAALVQARADSGRMGKTRLAQPLALLAPGTKAPACGGAATWRRRTPLVRSANGQRVQLKGPNIAQSQAFACLPRGRTTQSWRWSAPGALAAPREPLPMRPRPYSPR